MWISYRIAPNFETTQFIGMETVISHSVTLNLSPLNPIHQKIQVLK
jgi:hypothetical protein